MKGAADLKKTQLELEGRLRSAGLKATPTRVAILQVLSRGCGPLTVEQLHAQIKHTDCDLVTLYRALASFHKALLVRRCDLGDGPVRYEAHDRDGQHHHHVVCMECRQVESIDMCLVHKFESALRKRGYSNVSHSLEFYGVCGKCSRLDLLKPTDGKPLARRKRRVAAAV
jgi:Fur family transcriptional regulator, ferric uptake regulator